MNPARTDASPLPPDASAPNADAPGAEEPNAQGPSVKEPSPNGPIADQPSAKRIARTTLALFAGFATAQTASFLRNAFVGHMLSPGDFGIAATLALTLQLIEIASDLGADRLIVQHPQGDSPELVASVHSSLLLRGVIATAILLSVAPSFTSFMQIPAALWAFQIVAFAPLLKGFMHMDYRRRQRQLDNRGFLLVDSATQVAAAGIAVPSMLLARDYSAIAWVLLLQSALAVLLSHLVAVRPYRLGFDIGVLREIIRFGWPIWLSALPLIAVYQGERLLVGRVFGMSELALFSAAFMIAMVPGLIAAKVGQAVMLPLLAKAQDDQQIFHRRFQLMSDLTAAAAAGYLIFFTIAGGAILPLAFGAHYAGSGALVTCFAAAWAIRMVQAVAGMAMMAKGETRPLLIAGSIRALALIPALVLALQGFGITSITLTGFAGELASLIYMTRGLKRLWPHANPVVDATGENLKALPNMFARSTAILLPLAFLALTGIFRDFSTSFPVTILSALASATIAICAFLIMSPAIRAWALGRRTVAPRIRRHWGRAGSRLRPSSP